MPNNPLIFLIPAILFISACGSPVDQAGSPFSDLPRSAPDIHALPAVYRLDRPPPDTSDRSFPV